MKIWCALFLSVSYFELYAQNNLGPRLTAMGNNAAALTDVWSLQANAACITGIKSPTIATSYVQHLVDTEISTQSAGFVFPYQNNFLGISFQRYGFAAYNDVKIGFAYAKKLSPQLALALNTNLHQLQISSYGSSNTFSVDAGLLYTPSPLFSLGFYTMNLSGQSFNSQQNLKIASSLHTGLSYKPIDKVLIALTISKIYEQSIDVKTGIDYQLVPEFLNLRAGCSFKPAMQYAGLGIQLKQVQFDMAATYHNSLGYTPQIGISYAF